MWKTKAFLKLICSQYIADNPILRLANRTSSKPTKDNHIDTTTELLSSVHGFSEYFHACALVRKGSCFFVWYAHIWGDLNSVFPLWLFITGQRPDFGLVKIYSSEHTRTQQDGGTHHQAHWWLQVQWHNNKEQWLKTQEQLAHRANGSNNRAQSLKYDIWKLKFCGKPATSILIPELTCDWMVNSGVGG